MIYIYNNKDNQLVTDLYITDFIPSKVDLYLDEIYLGEFDNESTVAGYMVVSLTHTNISNELINLKNNFEYKLKIFINKSLEKIETVKVISGYEPIIINKK
jgi:hypothetical protein